MTRISGTEFVSMNYRNAARLRHAIAILRPAGVRTGSPIIRKAIEDASEIIEQAAKIVQTNDKELARIVDHISNRGFVGVPPKATPSVMVGAIANRLQESESVKRQGDKDVDELRDAIVDSVVSAIDEGKAAKVDSEKMENAERRIVFLESEVDDLRDAIVAQALTIAEARNY